MIPHAWGPATSTSAHVAADATVAGSHTTSSARSAPICPFKLSPQHVSAPAGSIAHVLASPADTRAAIGTPSGVTSDDEDETPSPSPSCPAQSCPTHRSRAALVDPAEAPGTEAPPRPRGVRMHLAGRPDGLVQRLTEVDAVEAPAAQRASGGEDAGGLEAPRISRRCSSLDAPHRWTVVEREPPVNSGAPRLGVPRGVGAAKLDTIQNQTKFGIVRTPPSPDPAALLRERGLQVTAQRIAVLRAVSGHPHGTADELAESVRSEIGAREKRAEERDGK